MNEFESNTKDVHEIPNVSDEPEITELADIQENIEIPETTDSSVTEVRGIPDSGAVSPAVAAFATEFHDLSSSMKGGWGERVVLSEIDSQNQVPILDHWDEPNRSGYDAVSFDPITGVIHIWEVKNWDGVVGEQALTAWTPARFEPNQADILEAIPESLAREQVSQALQDGRIEYHLRLGPETNLTAALAERIRTQNFPFRVDVASFTPEIMLAHDSGK